MWHTKLKKVQELRKYFSLSDVNPGVPDTELSVWADCVQRSLGVRVPNEVVSTLYVPPKR